VGDVVRIGDEIFGKAAILGIAAELRLSADRLPGGQTMLAVAAGRVKPWHADSVALLDDRDACAERDDTADGFVARDERDFGLEGPVAGRGVEIRVADAARLGLDEDLTGTGGRNIEFAEYEGFAELFDDGGVHSAGHFSISKSSGHRCFRVELRIRRRLSQGLAR
jgi:hypothetical protein